ncbi:MAG: hypothetical protein IT536_19855 [Hyphomicrobiales bacterium]|nr:hypothetical protein [Hyphomicrobiales bacterium]
MNVEAEIRDLKRRVSELGGSFGFLTQQVKAVHKGLLDFEAKSEQRFARVDRKIETLDRKVDALDRKVDHKVDSLAKALPRIVTDAVRTANRSRAKKR